MSKPVYDDERGWHGVTDKPDSHALAVYEAGYADGFKEASDLCDSATTGYLRGVADERARIKALIASLEYDGDYCKVLHSCDLLTAIDGEQA